MRRDMAENRHRVSGHADRADSPNGICPTETLDAVIVGAGYGIIGSVDTYAADFWGQCTDSQESTFCTD